MKTAYILVGVSGAGKSTICRAIDSRFVASNVGYFSLDDCRYRLYAINHGLDQDGNVQSQVTYNEVFKFATDNVKQMDMVVNDRWNRLLLTSDVLIVDNTNLTRKSRARWINEARAKGFSITAIQVMTPLQTVIDRQKTRGDKSVPAQVVHDMYMRQQEVLLGSEADRIINVDGTSADPINL